MNSVFLSVMVEGVDEKAWAVALKFLKMLQNHMHFGREWHRKLFLFCSRKLCAKAFNKPAYWGCSSFPNMVLMTALKVWRPWMNGTRGPRNKEVSSKYSVRIFNIEWAVDTTVKRPWRRKTTVDRCTCRKVLTSIYRWKRSATDCAASG